MDGIADLAGALACKYPFLAPAHAARLAAAHGTRARVVILAGARTIAELGPRMRAAISAVLMSAATVWRVGFDRKPIKLGSECAVPAPGIAALQHIGAKDHKPAQTQPLSKVHGKGVAFVSSAPQDVPKFWL